MCKIEAFDIVKLKMHDSIIKSLIRVRYTPNLKKYLLSLHALSVV